MSGKRAKALRAEFRRIYGRYPRRRADIEKRAVRGRAKSGEKDVPIGVALGRNITERHTFEDVINGVAQLVTKTRQVLRQIFEVRVTSPSEWRRWKRTGPAERLEFEIWMGWRNRRHPGILQVDPRGRALIAPAMELPRAA